MPDTRPDLDALRAIDEAIEGYQIAVKQWQRHADTVSHTEERLRAQVRAETWAAAVVDLSARRAALASPATGDSRPSPKATRIDWSNVVVDEGDEAP